MSDKITLKELEEKPYLICKVEDPTEEMIRAALKNSDYVLGRIENPTDAILIEEFGKANCYLKDVKKPLPEIPEDIAIKAAKNVANLEWIQAFCFVQEVLLKHVKMTKSIAKELLLIEPAYGKYDEVQAVLNKELERIAVDGFLKRLEQMKADGKEEYELYRWRFPENIPLTEDDYKYITDNHLEGYAFHFLSNREDMPLELRKIYLKNTKCSLSFIYIDDELIDYYFKIHPDCERLPKEFKYRDLCPILKNHGWVIKLISKPSVAERAAAIECDPMNVKYIKNPSEKDCIAALKANPDTYEYISKRTKRICEAIAMYL